jgi:endonuclease III
MLSGKSTDKAVEHRHAKLFQSYNFSNSFHVPQSVKNSDTRYRANRITPDEKAINSHIKTVNHPGF